MRVLRTVGSIVEVCQRCRRCKWCSMCDDAVNAFWNTCARHRQGHVLRLDKENRRNSVTHLHIYGISIFVGEPRRTVEEIIHIFVVGETYPRVIRIKATRNCTAARQIDPTWTTSRRGKRSKLKVTSLVVGQIFNFSTGRCARHTAEVSRDVEVRAQSCERASLRRRSFPDVKRLKRILTSERRATRCASIKK